VGFARARTSAFDEDATLRADAAGGVSDSDDALPLIIRLRAAGRAQPWDGANLVSFSFPIPASSPSGIDAKVGPLGLVAALVEEVNSEVLP